MFKIGDVVRLKGETRYTVDDQVYNNIWQEMRKRGLYVVTATEPSHKSSIRVSEIAYPLAESEIELADDD